MADPRRYQPSQQHYRQNAFITKLALFGYCGLLAWGLGLFFSAPVWAQPVSDNPYRQAPEQFIPNEPKEQNPSPYFMPDLVPYENRFWPSSTSPLYAPLTLEDRVARLEKLLMGAPQTGHLMERQWHLLNALTHQDKNGVDFGQANSPSQQQSLAPLEGFSKALDKPQIQPIGTKTPPTAPVQAATNPQTSAQGQLAQEKLKKLEMAMFDRTYPKESTTKRLNRLEKARYRYKEDSFPIASRLAQLEASIFFPVQLKQTSSTALRPLQWNNQNTLQADDMGFMPQGNANPARRGISSTLGEVGRSLLNLGTLAGLGYLSYRSGNNNTGWFQQGNGLYGQGFYGNGLYGVSPVTPFTGGLIQNTSPFIPPIGVPYAVPVFGSPFRSNFGGILQPTPFIQSSPVPPGFTIPLGQPQPGY
jgi:hypothetical protein